MKYTDLAKGLKTESRLVQLYSTTNREDDFYSALSRLLDAVDEMPRCEHSEYADGYCGEMGCPNYYTLAKGERTRKNKEAK